MQVIYADNLQTVREAMYGVRSDALLNDLRIGLQNRDQTILTELGRRYDADVEKNFEMVSGWDVVNASRKAVAGLQGFDAPTVILPMFTEEAFFKAPPIMQRFLMADPVIRQAHIKKRIDGWSDTYVDTQPKVVGLDHYDYRISNHGIVDRQVDTEGAVTYTATETFQELKPREIQLSTLNNLDIKRSAMFMRGNLRRGMKDLSSLYDEEVH